MVAGSTAGGARAGRGGRRGRRVAVAGLALAAALWVPAVAGARPADVVIVGTPSVRLDPSANTVKFDPGANTVRLHPDGNTVADALPAQVTAEASATNPTNGTGSCTPASFSLPAVPVLVEQVIVTFTGARLSNNPQAMVRLLRRRPDLTNGVYDLPVPFELETPIQTLTAAVPVGVVVFPGFSGTGIVHSISLCANRGGAGLGAKVLGLLVGRKQP